MRKHTLIYNILDSDSAIITITITITQYHSWLVVWSIFYVPSYMGKSFALTFICFKMVSQPPSRFDSAMITITYIWIIIICFALSYYLMIQIQYHKKYHYNIICILHYHLQYIYIYTLLYCNYIIIAHIWIIKWYHFRPKLSPGTSSPPRTALGHGALAVAGSEVGKSETRGFAEKNSKKTKITMDNYGKLEICIFLSLNFGFDSYNLKGFNPHRMDI